MATHAEYHMPEGIIGLCPRKPNLSPSSLMVTMPNHPLSNTSSLRLPNTVLVTTRRIYGDWTTAEMSGWKESLNSFAVQPIQQFRYTTGKNSTDSAMIIDAMDLLHAGSVRGFCIVSSDSDYTRLATRIREQGLFVMGVGKSTTPKAFVNACEVFVYTENLAPQAGKSAKVKVLELLGLD